jgi:hypothetical protein
MNSFNHPVRESRNLPMKGPVRSSTFQLNRDIFAWQHTTCLSPPKDSFKIAESSSHNDSFCNNTSEGLRRHFLWANRDTVAWQHSTCLSPPRELITPCEGPRHQFLRANRDVFTSQQVNTHGPPKETTEATNKIYFYLANSLPVTFTYFQYYSGY